MKKTLLALSLCLFLFVTAISCSEDDSNTEPAASTPTDSSNTEFIATQSDFDNYQTWPVRK